MKLVVVRSTLTAGSVVRLVALGWTCGFGGLCLFPFALALVGTISGGAANVKGWTPGFTEPALLVLLPIILAVQGLVIGLVCALGVWIYSQFRPIKLEVSDSRGSGA